MMSKSTGGGHRTPESNSAPGPATSMAGILKSLSTGEFHYEALKSSSTSEAGEVNSSKARLEDHRQAQCSCGPFLGWRVKQLGGSRNCSNKVSRLWGGMHETPAARFLIRLLASYGRLRESIKETNVNVYDLFVGNQMLCLLTASPIMPRTETFPSPSSSRRLTIVPMTSFSRNGSNFTTDGRAQSSKSLPYSRGGDSHASRRHPSSRR